MLNLFKVFVDIALWRKGPQDLPASTTLLLAAVAAYIVVSLSLANAIRPDERALARTALEAGVGLAWLWLLLRLFRRPARFQQTATAMLGTGTLIVPIVIGLQAALLWVGEKHALTMPLVLVLLTVFVWYLLITAHIIRAALEVNLFVAIVLTLLYLSCEYLATEQLLKPTA